MLYALPPQPDTPFEGFVALVVWGTVFLALCYLAGAVIEWLERRGENEKGTYENRN